jgi:hypothetical protein
MSWRIEQANPLALLRELPDGLFQTGILRTPADLPETDVPPVLRELHRVTREDGTLWLLGATHEAAAIEAGWRRPTGRAVHPRPERHGSGCLTVALMAKNPGCYFNARLPLPGTPRRVCGHERSARGLRHRRRAWCVPLANRRDLPQQLIDWCIQASTSPRACQICGAPWRRYSGATDIDRVWRPGCEHGNGRGRCLVIDPFCGTGLTGVLAVLAGRSFLGIEHDPLLARHAQRRFATANRSALR